jgi:DNA polymerase eta
LLHADLDGFYAQVEARRLGLDASVAAIGVLQWDSLIALSYPAKGCGVRRGMSSAEAQRLCPQITLAHVEVIFTSGEVVEDLVAYERRTGRRPRGECKASLSRYREASAEVFNALGRELPECVERASIDEAYVDASAAAEALRGRAKADGSAIDTVAGGRARDEWAIVGGAAGIGAADEPLLRGALVAERLRAVVREKTGFTMSVGVARSRPLAKLASSRHKPNRVSLVPAAAARELLSSVRLRDIGGLGGKLGEAVARAFGLSADATAAELWRHPRETLCERIGAARGKFVYDRIRGIGQDNVTPNLLVNSVSACKSFTATSARRSPSGSARSQERCARALRQRQTSAGERRARSRCTSASVAAPARRAASGRDNAGFHPPERPSARARWTRRARSSSTVLSRPWQAHPCRGWP